MMDLFFSFNGRINRAKYWLGTVCLIVVYVILAVISGAAMSSDGSTSIVGIIVMIVYLAMI